VIQPPNMAVDREPVIAVAAQHPHSATGVSTKNTELYAWGERTRTAKRHFRNALKYHENVSGLVLRAQTSAPRRGSLTGAGRSFLESDVCECESSHPRTRSRSLRYLCACGRSHGIPRVGQEPLPLPRTCSSWPSRSWTARRQSPRSLLRMPPPLCLWRLMDNAHVSFPQSMAQNNRNRILRFKRMRYGAPS